MSRIPAGRRDEPRRADGYTRAGVGAHRHVRRRSKWPGGIPLTNRSV